MDLFNLSTPNYAESHSVPFQVAAKFLTGIKDFGGPGSGNFGHSGRLGQIGGSSASGGGPAGTTERSAAEHKGLSEALSKARRVGSPQTLTDADKKILQQSL